MTLQSAIAVALLIGVSPTSAWALATESSLRLDRVKYGPGVSDCLHVEVTDPDEDRDPGLVDAVKIDLLGFSPETGEIGDEERLAIPETAPGSGTFRNVECVPLRGGEPVPGDGTIQVEPGHLIGAVYQDADNPANPESLEDVDLAFDLAFVTGGRSSGTFRYRIDPDILPEEWSSTPGRLPGEPPRPLAVVARRGALPAVFGADQVIYLPARPGDLSDFVERRHGLVLSELEIPDEGDPPAPPGRRYAVIRMLGGMEEDLRDFGYLAELAGIEGEWIFSSEDAARLAAIVLEEQLGGGFVAWNQRMWLAAAPIFLEGNADGDGLTDGWWTGDPIGFRRAALYLDLIDRNRAGSVDVAIVDGGFAGPDDYPDDELVPYGGNNPDFGAANFASLPQGDCSVPLCTGRADGRNPLTCSGVNSCPWHGTKVFSVAGAVANNGFGRVGIAGHGRDVSSGLDGQHGVMRPLLLKVGDGYVADAAAAIDHARESGVDVVNLSSFIPCEPWSDIDICSDVTRNLILVGCLVADFLIAHVVPPGIGALIGALGCGELVTFLDYVAGERPMLARAVERATREGVTVVAAGPENVNLPSPLELIASEGPFDARDVELIPCTLDGVICVGAMNQQFDPRNTEDTDTPSPGRCDDGVDNGMDGSADEHDPQCWGEVPASFNPIGSGIDIWAPGVGIGTTPTPGSDDEPTSFSGTSAAAPFVAGTAALMKAANPALRPEDVLRILQETSRVFPHLEDPRRPCEAHPTAPDACVGYVDVFAAVRESAGITLACDGLDERRPRATRLTREIRSLQQPPFSVSVGTDAGFGSTGQLLIGQERFSYVPDPVDPVDHFWITQRALTSGPSYHPVGERVLDVATLSDDLPQDAGSTPNLSGSVGSSVTIPGNKAIHTLPMDLPGLLADEDWYRFSVPANPSGAGSTELAVELVSDDTLSLQLLAQAGELLAETSSAGGHGALSGLLAFVGRTYRLRVAPGPSRFFHDSCYTNGLTLRVTGVGPRADIFDAGGAENDTPGSASSLGNWSHRHANPAIYAQGVSRLIFLPQTEEWSQDVPDLTLHSETDRDFYRIRIPDPADEADGGHPNIDPDHDAYPEQVPPEPLPECGTVERRNAEGIPVPVDFAGRLIVDVDFTNEHADERVTGELADLASRPGGAYVIPCPGGPRELPFAVGDGAMRDLAATYGLDLRYEIDITRFSSPTGWMQGEREVRGASSVFPLFCGAGRFPVCPQIFDVEHPVDTSRLGDCRRDGPGCPQFLLLPWPGGTLELLFSSPVELHFELFDETRTQKLAEALPAARVTQIGVAPDGFPDVFQQRLVAAGLSPGLYVLVVNGTATTYTVGFQPPVVELPIDVKPGSDVNPLNPRSRGSVPVAILPAADFDPVEEVDRLSLTFGPTGYEASPLRCRPKEAGEAEEPRALVCHFATAAAGFECGDVEAVLRGRTREGLELVGRDAVRVGPCR